MVRTKIAKQSALPAQILSKLTEYGEEFPRGTRVGRYRVQGRTAVVLDDGSIVMRCIADGAHVSCWKTITSLRNLRTRDAK